MRKNSSYSQFEIIYFIAISSFPPIYFPAIHQHQHQHQLYIYICSKLFHISGALQFSIWQRVPITVLKWLNCLQCELCVRAFCFVNLFVFLLYLDVYALYAMMHMYTNIPLRYICIYNNITCHFGRASYKFQAQIHTAVFCIQHIHCYFAICFCNFVLCKLKVSIITSLNYDGCLSVFTFHFWYSSCSFTNILSFCHTVHNFITMLPSIYICVISFAFVFVFVILYLPRYIFVPFNHLYSKRKRKNGNPSMHGEWGIWSYLHVFFFIIIYVVDVLYSHYKHRFNRFFSSVLPAIC